MKYTTHYAIPYPEPSDPPTISTHIENIAKNIDTTMWNYQQSINSQLAAFTSSEAAARQAFETSSQAQWAAWKAPMDARMTSIENALKQQGWGTPIALSGTIYSPASGWTAIAGSTAAKVGNVCAFNINFQKAADPALVAGASGNIASTLIGTLNAAVMPKPTTYAPFSTMTDGFQIMGYINASRQIYITALAPNVNLPKTYTMTLGGMYMFDPTVA